MGNIVGALDAMQEQSEQLIKESAGDSNSVSEVTKQKTAVRKLEALLRQEKEVMSKKISALQKVVQKQKALLAEQKSALGKMETALVASKEV